MQNRLNWNAQWISATWSLISSPSTYLSLFPILFYFTEVWLRHMDWRCSSTQYLESVTGRSGEVFGWLLNCQQLISFHTHSVSFLSTTRKKWIYRPFYRYGGHIELIGVKEYYGMPRGSWAQSDILASVFTCAFWASFSLSFPKKRL